MSVVDVQKGWTAALSRRQRAAPVAGKRDSRDYKKHVGNDKGRAKRQLGRLDGTTSARQRACRSLRQQHWLATREACEAVEILGALMSLQFLVNVLGCGALQPRDMTEITLMRGQAEQCSATQCSQCSSGRGCQVIKSLDEIPEPLRGLSKEVCDVLSSLEIDVGPTVRATNRGGSADGYRQHTTMMRFRWKESLVKDAIKDLDLEDDRKAAKMAVKHLMTDDDCAYKEFTLEHKEFLKENPDANE